MEPQLNALVRQVIGYAVIRVASGRSRAGRMLPGENAPAFWPVVRGLLSNLRFRRSMRQATRPPYNKDNRELARKRARTG
jgi:hypothetical protein